MAGIPAVAQPAVAAKPAVASKTGSVVQVYSEEEFDQILRESSNLVVLDVYTQWCGPCKIFAPKFESMAAESGGRITFLKMDVNENDSTDNLARERLHTTAIPSFYFFRNGEMVGQFRGIQEAPFRNTLNELALPEEQLK
jgi:thioredoxin-like negative regulator of GroEL